MLYREGREAQIRKYLVDELNCLDTVMLLPDTIFHSNGQAEIFLFLHVNRSEDDVLFFGCSEVEEFNREQVKTYRHSGWSEKRFPVMLVCI